MLELLAIVVVRGLMEVVVVVVVVGSSTGKPAGVVGTWAVEVLGDGETDVVVVGGRR
jgi:hypothetical protein